MAQLGNLSLFWWGAGGRKRNNVEIGSGWAQRETELPCFDMARTQLRKASILPSEEEEDSVQRGYFGS